MILNTLGMKTKIKYSKIIEKMIFNIDEWYFKHI